MVVRSNHSAFLDLPPELRNRIYTFATYPAAGERSCVAPCVQLILTCKQVYHEYRPICMKADVTINWRDVPRYFQQYFTKDGALNIKLAPSRMTIITDVFRRHDKSVEIDMLPLIKLRLANRHFECEFIVSRGEEVKCSTAMHHAALLPSNSPTILLKADATTLQKLIAHREASWIEDVAKARVHKIIVSHIGTNCCPQATFHIGEGEDNSVLSEFEGCSKVDETGECRSFRAGESMTVNKGMFDDYLDRAKLQTVFTDNEYRFLPGFEWNYKTAVVSPCVKSESDSSVPVA